MRIPRALLLVLLVVPIAARAGEESDADGDRDGTREAELIERRLESPPETGVLVTRVARGSPAAAVGVRAGDVIIAFRGEPTPDLERLRGTERRRAFGPSLLFVQRGDELLRLSVEGEGGLGVTGVGVKKGRAAAPLPAATETPVRLARAVPQRGGDLWYQVALDGQVVVGYEHVVTRREDARITIVREMAFDDGKRRAHLIARATFETGAAFPRLVATRFEGLTTGQVITGRRERAEGPEGAGGRDVWVHTKRGDDGASEELARFAAPDAMVPVYAVATLAAALPRERGACVHFRVLDERSGRLGPVSALIVAGPEPVRAEGRKIETWRLEWRGRGRRLHANLWVDDDGPFGRESLGGQRSIRASREKAYEPFAPRLEARTDGD